MLGCNLAFPWNPISSGRPFWGGGAAGGGGGVTFLRGGGRTGLDRAVAIDALPTPPLPLPSNRHNEQEYTTLLNKWILITTKIPMVADS